MKFKDIEMGYVKKTALGYKESDEEKHTHIVMDEENFERLIDDIVSGEEEYKNQIDNLDWELKQAKERNGELRKENIDIQKKSEGNLIRAKQMMDEAEELKQEAERIRDEQRVEIENIRRIYKETINSARGLKPKKSHTGYCVISSAEKTYRYKPAWSNYFNEEILWETILETPYTVDFTPEDIRKHFMEDMFDSNKRWKIAEIGITGRHLADGDKKEGKYEELRDDDYWGKDDKYKETNIILEPQIKANYKTGYWEIIFYHTKPLENVPATWRRNTYS